MSKPINQSIQKATITKRYNDCVIESQLDFIPPTINNVTSTDIFWDGDIIQFNIKDEGSASGISIVEGQVQKVKTNIEQNNIIQNITARSKGFLLVKQPFNWDCTISEGKSHTTIELLRIILEDTGIVIGRDQEGLFKNISYNTKGSDRARFCGKFDTKKDAIDQLFLQYAKLSGANKMRWYIDAGGYLRWFEIRTDRTNKGVFFKEDKYVKSIVIESNSENIVNDQEVFGGDQGELYSHKSDDNSINRFYRQIGKPINDTKLTTQEETDKEADKIIKQRAYPFYTATLTLINYNSVEQGQQIQFPNYPGHETRMFTVMDVIIKVEGVDNTTTVNLTTDETAISMPNTMEMIETVAESKANTAKAEEAVCVGRDPDDLTKIIFKTKSGTTVKSARTTEAAVFDGG